MRIILGSSSPRRKKLLEEAGIKNFEIIAPDIEESGDDVKEISLQKAIAIKEKVNDSAAIILTADTMLFFNGRSIGKPKSKEKAAELLRELSGKSSITRTGYCIIKNTKICNEVESTEVKFRELTENEINEYVNTHPVETMAGGFNIDKGTEGEKFVESINGLRTTVVGLPIEKILPLL